MTNIPGWVGPTIAIALVVIALGFVAFVAAILLAGKRAAEEATQLGREVAELRKELAPTIQAVNTMATATADLGGQVKGEVVALLATSRRIRRRVSRGARRVEGRLEELDTLYEVVSAEVEETALDVASKLRAFRAGTSALARIKRFLGRGRR